MMRSVTVCVLLLLAGVFSVLHFALGDSGFLTWAVTVICGILCLTAATVAFTFIIAKVPLRPLHLTMGAYAGEFFATVKLYGIDVLRGAPEITKPPLRAKELYPNHLPILFIHGFSCNAGFWRDHLASIGPRWGSELATINLEPIHGPINGYAKQINDQIDELLLQTKNTQCLIVAHSMGGLATRSYLYQYPEAEKIKGVITLGTPHHGTTLANFSLGENSRQMRRVSAWREELLSMETTAANRPPFECLVGTHDNIVAPQASAEYELGINTYMVGVTHLGMAYDRKVIEWTFDRLGRLCQSEG